MRLTSLFFLLHEGYLNVRRNGLMSVAALGTVAVTLTVLGGSLWSVYRINEFAQQQPQTFNEIDVFLKPDIERDDAKVIGKRIAQLPNVKAIHLITREQAWKDLTAQEPTLTAAMPEDPLPDAFHIEAADTKLLTQLTTSLRDNSKFPEIEKVTDAGSEVRLLLGFARLVKIIGGAAAAGLFVATMFIVYNTIRLTVFARRREIRIMQLVGATSWFIRMPLLLEGLFHGIAGAVIAGLVVIFGSKQLASFVSQIHSPLWGDVPSQATPFKMFSTLVLVGAFVGLTGSYFSMRRYLRLL